MSKSPLWFSLQQTGRRGLLPQPQTSVIEDDSLLMDSYHSELQSRVSSWELYTFSQTSLDNSAGPKGSSFLPCSLPPRCSLSWPILKSANHLHSFPSPATDPSIWFCLFYYQTQRPLKLVHAFHSYRHCSSYKTLHFFIACSLLLSPRLSLLPDAQALHSNHFILAFFRSFSHARQFLYIRFPLSGTVKGTFTFCLAKSCLCLRYQFRCRFYVKLSNFPVTCSFALSHHTLFFRPIKRI